VGFFHSVEEKQEHHRRQVYTLGVMLLIHCPSTAYSLPIHCLCTAYSLLISLLMSPPIALPTHCLFTACMFLALRVLLPIHWLFTAFCLPLFSNFHWYSFSLQRNTPPAPMYSSPSSHLHTIITHHCSTQLSHLSHPHHSLIISTSHPPLTLITSALHFHHILTASS
jgi:hypothetical protein